MVVAGVGWMTMLSGLNVAAQLATASWVRARVLSVYMLVFQGALALGSFLWGEVATRVGVRRALLAAAAALVGKSRDPRPLPARDRRRGHDPVSLVADAEDRA
jgi:hypothetical protein